MMLACLRKECRTFVIACTGQCDVVEVKGWPLKCGDERCNFQRVRRLLAVTTVERV